MTTNADIQAVADSVLDKYKAQLNEAIAGHEKLLEHSRDHLAKMVAESNQQMAELMAKVNASAPPAKPLAEVAWVSATGDGEKDHLVLNPQAVALIDKLFSAINQVLPELAKLVKNR